MKIKEKISNLSLKELGKLLAECFFLVGKDFKKLPPDELEIFLKEVAHWQGWMWVDTFREAFSAYQSGILEIEKFTPYLTPMTVSKICNAYKDKTFGKKDKQHAPEPEFIPSSDEGYYNSLVCCMNGVKSEKFEKYFPKTRPLREVMAEKSGGLPIIPFTWDWWAVYRHLRTLGLCDESDSIEGQKKSVITWLRINWAGAKFQEDFFPKDKGTLGGMLKRAAR